MMQKFSSSSFVAGVIAGGFLAGAWFAAEPTELFSLSSALNLSTDRPARALAEPSTAISVSDQAAGNSVHIAAVNVPASVWVAVREMNGQNLGNVLGAVRLTGPHTGVTVPLLRGTMSNRLYAIELYRDDATGAFDPANFSVYVDFDSGTRVVTYFHTTEDYHGS